ncbi:hypothetical protein RZS08_02325, partial [Arthrospira platensis SPKY1]|nr:hypothetical protein [Arthrospira platensis SPKY1]
RQGALGDGAEAPLEARDVLGQRAQQRLGVLRAGDDARLHPHRLLGVGEREVEEEGIVGVGDERGVGVAALGRRRVDLELEGAGGVRRRGGAGFGIGHRGTS